MRPTTRRLAVSAAVLLAVIAAAGCGPKKEASIKVGIYGSMTGTTATFGKSTLNGAQLAFDELNAAGGIGGKKIEYVSEDDQSKAEEAATAVQKLINQDHVIALIGEVASSRSLAAAPIAQSNGVPMISPSSTNPEVTLKGNYIFRACFLDEFQGRVMARFAVDSLKFKRVAILKDIKNDYSVGLAQFFSEEYKAHGGRSLVRVSITSAPASTSSPQRLSATPRFTSASVRPLTPIEPGNLPP